MSKGLEWGKVTLYNDFKDIEKLFKRNNIKNEVDLLQRAAMNDTEANHIIQEINLFYVGITRAKYSLENNTKNILH